jgi:hypothetical protein
MFWALYDCNLAHTSVKACLRKITGRSIIFSISPWFKLPMCHGTMMSDDHKGRTTLAITKENHAWSLFHSELQEQSSVKLMVVQMMP